MPYSAISNHLGEMRLQDYELASDLRISFIDESGYF